MKNLFKFAACALLAVVLMACENGGGEGDHDMRLKTPQANFFMQEDTVIISWSKVENAVYYELQISGYELIKTESTSYVLENLIYGESYTVELTAIAAETSPYLNSKTATYTLDIPARKIPQYREFLAGTIALSAISNNGRYAVGSFAETGVFVNLMNDDVVDMSDFAPTDVADNGLVVGAYTGEILDGVAAYWYNGEVTKIDLSEVCSNLVMSALTSVTPDGKYMVGWLWRAGSSTEHVELLVPITYDIEKDRVWIPESNNSIYEGQEYVNGKIAKSVDPERRIFGYEDSYAHFMISWADEYTPYDYLLLETENNTPTKWFADLAAPNMISQTGRYAFGRILTSDGNVESMAVCAYKDMDTNTVHELTAHPDMKRILAMDDNGLLFADNVKDGYGGETTYVIDTINSPNTKSTFEDWLLDIHNVELYDYIEEDGLTVVAVSEDCRTFIGTVNTIDRGWVSMVISLDGEPMPEKEPENTLDEETPAA